MGALWAAIAIVFISLSISPRLFAADPPFKIVEDPFSESVVRVRLDFGNNMYSHCTGTLISPTVVLTARHCLEKGARPFIQAGRGKNKREVQVSGMAFRGVAGQSILNVYNKDGTVSDFFVWHTQQSVSKDILLLFLNQPITDIASLVLTPPAELNYGIYKTPVQLVGYPANSTLHDEDGTMEPVTLGECWVKWFSLNGRVLRTTCTAYGGNSGGPLLVKAHDQMQVLGVISTADGRVTSTSEPQVYKWIQEQIKIH